ncbi:MAG: hypothetical protein ACKO0V_05755 [bacterium]
MKPISRHYITHWSLDLPAPNGYSYWKSTSRSHYVLRENHPDGQ